jgi:hypothetical protein
MTIASLASKTENYTVQKPLKKNKKRKGKEGGRGTWLCRKFASKGLRKKPYSLCRATFLFSESH